MIVFPSGFKPYTPSCSISSKLNLPPCVEHCSHLVPHLFLPGSVCRGPSGWPWPSGGQLVPMLDECSLRRDGEGPEPVDLVPRIVTPVFRETAVAPLPHFVVGHWKVGWSVSYMNFGLDFVHVEQFSISCEKWKKLLLLKTPCLKQVKLGSLEERLAFVASISMPCQGTQLQQRRIRMPW